MNAYRFKPEAVFADPAFPLACRRWSGSSVFLHRHDFHELVIVLTGSAQHTLNGSRSMIAAGDVFLVRGKTEHAYTETQNLSYIDIYFDPQRLHLPMSGIGSLPGYHALFRIEPRVRQNNRTGAGLRLSAPALADACLFASQLERELADSLPGHRFIAAALLLRLIRFLSLHYAESETSNARQWLTLGKVLTHIDRHFAEDLAVGQLARLAGLSERTLARLFHRVMGQPPMDYVIRVRIDRARKLLAAGARVTETAFACGFNDSAYFSRQFRKVTGMTPLVFRKQNATPGRRAADADMEQRMQSADGPSA